MKISVIDPIGYSLKRMKLILFSELDVGKWFVLGFCAFLADLCGSGGSFLGSMNGVFDNKSMEIFPFDKIANFVSGHLTIVVIAILVLFFIVLAVWVLLLWLSSRGIFMFLDGVIRNQAAVSRPWRQFRLPADSLFQIKLYLVLAWITVMLLVLVVCLLVAWPDISMKRFGVNAMIASIVGIFLSLLLSLAFILITQVLKDFVVPVMYRRNIETLMAVRVFWQEILPGHAGVFAMFYLMKIFLAIAAGAIVLLAGCITCCILFCITSLPYIASVLLLPVSTFFRCYSLFFLEQFGDQWSFFKNSEPQ